MTVFFLTLRSRWSLAALLSRRTAFQSGRITADMGTISNGAEFMKCPITGAKKRVKMRKVCFICRLFLILLILTSLTTPVNGQEYTALYVMLLKTMQFKPKYIYIMTWNKEHVDSFVNDMTPLIQEHISEDEVKPICNIVLHLYCPTQHRIGKL